MGTAHNYTLQLLLVLVGTGSELIDITSSGATHFKLKFFLSYDDVYDDIDATVVVEMTLEQRAELQVWLLTFSVLGQDRCCNDQSIN